MANNYNTFVNPSKALYDMFSDSDKSELEKISKAKHKNYYDAVAVCSAYIDLFYRDQYKPS